MNEHVKAEVLSPIYDVTFKLLFATKENEPLLKSLLAAILGLPAEKIKKIEHINSELKPPWPEGKFVRLGLYVDQRKINIEVQKHSQKGFRERSLFYWSRMFQDEVEKGGHFTDLPETICINLLDFILLPCSKYHSVFMLLELESHELLSDKMRLDFLELPKIPAKQINAADLKLLWMLFLSTKEEGEFAMLEQAGNAEISAAIKRLRYYSADETVRRAVEREMDRQRDEENYRYEACLDGEEKGRREGKIEGRCEEKQKTVWNMLQEGFDIAVISRITGLSEEQIAELQQLL